MLSKEAIRPIQKTDKTTSIFDRFGIELKPMELFQDLIHNPYPPEKGWHFGTGDPEFWKFSSKFIVPGGKALDLGSGLGRTSIPFALQGMEVAAYETNPAYVRAMKAVAENFDLPISVLNEDVRTADFGKNKYDTVILGQTFAHFESREEAFKVLDKAIDAVKPGGHIWFRGNGKGYDIEGQTPSLNGSKEHYMNTCSCSGEKRMEKHLFFDPFELIEYMSEKGIKVAHTQMAPERGKTNIMYGEDWEPDRDYFDEEVGMEDIFSGVFDDEVVEDRNVVDAPKRELDRAGDIITIIGQKIKKINVASNTGC